MNVKNHQKSRKVETLKQRIYHRYTWDIFHVFSKHLFYVVWRTGTNPILTHDCRRQFGLSGIRTYVHPYASPELYHCGMDSDNI